MAQETYKYSIEYRERFGFNGTEIYWMVEAFKLFSEKADYFFSMINDIYLHYQVEAWCLDRD